MGRDPFVWQVQLREDVVDDVLAELQRLPYAIVRELISSPQHKIVKARDDKKYAVTVTAELTAAGSEEIRVTVSLTHGWFGRTLTESFTVSPSDDAP